MHVELSAEHATITDPDNLRELDLVTALDGPEQIRTALARAGIGEPDTDPTHVLLDVRVLRGRARAAATTPDWDAGWDTMIEFAASRGWLSEDGTRVRAHVARP